MTPDLATLIERLEKASGPDPLLDKDIHLEVFTTITLPDCPAYTGSSDAALPEEVGAYIEVTGPRKYLNIPTTVPNYWRVEMIFGNSPPYNTVVAWAATEPLARRAASLRARLELTKGVRS